eukprot:TRINITY_DN1992_c0_g1_i3.p2 TRINITY_DN1992_c0_g1~~TRINITY_DN1992_c0_g1_i3.p2  ORF type:complete len:324 (+),score=47.27 TRINITY_DN1992_c0_g1_i3:141-1112(+)
MSSVPVEEDDSASPLLEEPSVPFSNNVESKNKHAPTTMFDRVKGAAKVTALVILACSIGVFLLVLLTSDYLQTQSVELLEWLEDLPVVPSMLLMVLFYAFALVFFCPGTPFNLASGFLYNFWFGSLVAVVGCVLGAFAAFILGRTIAREWVKRKIDQYQNFRAVDFAIQKKGMYIVFLTRLSPLFPFPLLNYAFGITKISVPGYVGGTFLGILPGTVAYAYLGTLMRDLTDMWSGGSSESGNDSSVNALWMVVASLMTLVSIAVISWITKRAIASATREYEASQASLDKDADDDAIELKLVDSAGTTTVFAGANGRRSLPLAQ